MLSVLPSSFSRLKFLQSPSYDLREEANNFKDFVSYHFSPHGLAINKPLFQTVLDATDDIIHLSAIHDLVEEFGFSFDDLNDLFALTSFPDLSVLNKTHCRLEYRIFKLYCAIAVSIDKVLGCVGSLEDTNPWIELKTLALNHSIITTDIDLMTKALASDVTNKVECKAVEGVFLVRRTPNIVFHTNGLDRIMINIPYEYKSGITDNEPSPPARLFRRNVVNAYKPLAFEPTQLHVHSDSAVVSVKQLLDLFPEINTFIVSHGTIYLTVDNHYRRNTSEFLVGLYHTIVRVAFADCIMDATFSIYDADKYKLTWCAIDGYSLTCRRNPNDHCNLDHPSDKSCIPTSDFLGDRFTVL